MSLRILPILIGLLFAGNVEAALAWAEADADGSQRVHLYFFWSETCPHYCKAAHPFIAAISREWPWVTLHLLEVSRSRENVQRFEAMAQARGQSAEAVPTFMLCGLMLVGWQDEATSGAVLLRALDACRAGDVRAAASAVEASAIDLPLLGRVGVALGITFLAARLTRETRP